MQPSISRRTYVATVGAAGLGALGGCTDLASFGTGDGSTESWTTFRGDRANSGVRSADAGPGRSMAIDWQSGWSTVVEEIEGLDPTDVEPYFSANTNPETAASVAFSGPVLTASTVICSVGYRWYDPATETEYDRIAAIGIDQSDGAIRWSHTLRETRTTDTDEIDPNMRSLDLLAWYGGEIVDESVVFPAASDSGIGAVRLDVETGELRDEFDLGLADEYDRPRVADGRLYTVDAPDDVRLRAFDLDDGTEAWSTPIDVPLGGTTGFPSVSLESDRVWTVERSDADVPPVVVARDARTGDERIRESLDLPGVRENLGALAFGPEYAYAAGGYSARALRDTTPLVSIDPADGTERWRYEPPPAEREGRTIGGIYGFPVVVDDSVIAMGWGPLDDGESDDVRYLLAVNERDGSLEWTMEFDALGSVPVVAGDTIYLDTPASVSAISPDGERLDALGSDHPSTIERSPALGYGRLYVSRSDALLAIG